MLPTVFFFKGRVDSFPWLLKVVYDTKRSFVFGLEGNLSQSGHVYTLKNLVISIKVEKSVMQVM